MNGQELFGRAVRLDVARERGAYTPQSGYDSQLTHCLIPTVNASLDVQRSKRIIMFCDHHGFCTCYRRENYSYQKGSKGHSQTIFVRGFDKSLEEDQVLFYYITSLFVIMICYLFALFLKSEAHYRLEALWKSILGHVEMLHEFPFRGIMKVVLLKGQQLSGICV